jgi:hypothetical protein
MVCLPTGGRGSRANLLGGQVLGSDPDVESAGVDTGFAPTEDTLRAPDVAVGNVPDEPGWVHGVPPLAVEYADTGQDEQDLVTKIHDLLAAGTRFLWVVRLTGPRRVEIHEQDQPMRVVYPGETLHAPGILRNPVPVDALYDPKEANQATFRNLLQRQGYDSIDAILAEGKAEGKMEGKAEGKAEGKLEGLAEGEVSGRLQALQQALFEVVSARGFRLSEQHRALIEACTDLEQLSQWLRGAVTATSDAEIFPPGDGAG